MTKQDNPIWAGEKPNSLYLLELYPPEAVEIFHNVFEALATWKMLLDQSAPEDRENNILQQEQVIQKRAQTLKEKFPSFPVDAALASHPWRQK